MRDNIFDAVVSSGSDKKAIEEAVALSVGAVKTWLEEGVGPAMNRYNTKTR